MNRAGKFLMVSILSVLVISCGKDRTREEQVSAMVNSINSPFLIASMNVQNLMDKSEVLKEGTLPFTYHQVISFFLAADLTGIDYNADAQFVMSEGESFLPNFYGIFKVEKEELFVELLKVEANAEIKEQDGMKYAIKDSERYCVVWNEEFAVISNIPMDIAGMLSGKGSEQGEKMIAKNIEIIKAANEGEVSKDYVDFLKKDVDIAMHYDGEGFYDYMALMAMGEKEQLEKMKEFYLGMSYEMYINFNEGSIGLEAVAEWSDDLRKKLSFIGESGVSDKLFKYGKIKSPLIVSTYKVDVKSMMDYFEDMSVEDYENMIVELEENGLALEDIETAMTGEIVLMMDGIMKKEKTHDIGPEEAITVEEDELIFAIVLGVADKGLIERKLQKIAVAATLENTTVMTDDGAMQQSEMPELKMMTPNGVIGIGDTYMYLMDDALFMSNDSSWTNLIAGGNGTSVNNPGGVLTENPMGIFANLTSLADFEGMDEKGAEMMKMLSSFYGSANLDGGKFTLELTDDSENALKRITVMAGSVLAQFEKNSNPDMEAELEEALEETEDVFERLEKDIDVEELEKTVDDAMKQLNQ